MASSTIVQASPSVGAQVVLTSDEKILKTVSNHRHKLFTSVISVATVLPDCICDIVYSYIGYADACPELDFKEVADAHRRNAVTSVITTSAKLPKYLVNSVAEYVDLSTIIVDLVDVLGENLITDFARPLDLSYLDIRGFAFDHFYTGDYTITTQRSLFYLADVKFNHSNLSYVNLSEVDLGSADFTHATLIGANFSNTDLFRAIFFHANLTRANMTGTFIDKDLFIDSDMARVRY